MNICAIICISLAALAAGSLAQPMYGQSASNQQQVAYVTPAQLAQYSQAEANAYYLPSRQQQQRQQQDYLVRRARASNKKRKEKKKKQQRNFELDCLETHNKWRRLHQVGDLEFDAKVS